MFFLIKINWFLGDHLRRTTRDIIHIEPGATTEVPAKDGAGATEKFGKKFNTFDEFISFMLLNCVDDEVFDEVFFSRYLIPNVLWSTEVLSNYFRSEYVELTQSDIETGISCKLKLGDLMTVEEKKTNFATKFGGPIKEVDEIDLLLPGRRSLTGGQIIQLLIRQVLYKLRQQTKTFDEHAKIFYLRGHSFKDLQLLHKARREHLEFVSTLTNRFILKFIATIKKEKQNPNTKWIDNRFVMLYCDIIEGQIVGEGRHRLLWQFPYVQGINSMYLHEISNPIFYCKVEKSKFKNIRFKICNEQGVNLNFVDAFTPTYVCLSFKRSLKMVEGDIQMK